MEKLTLYNLDELIALITSVIIGTGTYISFVWKERKVNVTVAFVISVLFINTFITYIFSEILKKWDWGGYRTIILPLVALSGQYLMDWLDKRYLKIFDAGLNKVGLKLENEEKYEENESGRDT